MHEPGARGEHERERRIYRLFEISILLKGMNAVLELAGGTLVLLIPPALVQGVAAYFTAAELGQDPDDFIATNIMHWADLYAAGAHPTFIALYLLSHGVVKLAVVIGLLKNWPRAYPTALAVFGLFTAYQIYLLTHRISPGMVVLTIFDFAVLYLIWREWRIVTEHHRTHTPVPGVDTGA